MKNAKTLCTAGAVAAVLSLGNVAPAMAELSASAAVSNIYLFRGVDQGPGTGAVSGDITYSVGGFYGSIWTSSAGGSEEVDFIAGWGGEFGGLGVDIGVINYYYPGFNAYDTVGALTEAYIGLSFAGLEFYYYDNVAGKGVEDPSSFGTYGDDGFVYYTLGYSLGKWSALVGMADPEEASGQTFDDDYTHVDLTYAFNDNLSFTVSKIVDMDDELNVNKTSSVLAGTAALDDDTLFVVTYSIPLK